MTERVPRPAFYAAAPGRVRDWWTLLHPPYTLWHLSYVVLGALVAPRVDAGRLVLTVLAFFAAVGVAAHALDELDGRPLRTSIPRRSLLGAVAVGLVVAVGLGVYGIARIGWPLVPFVVVGPLLVVGYNAELFGGRMHSDAWFALAWGAFPALVGYVAQAKSLDIEAVLVAVAAFALSAAQRSLSTPARALRRRILDVEGHVTYADGTVRPITRATLLGPLEAALWAASWGLVILTLALAIAWLT